MGLTKRDRSLRLQLRAEAAAVESFVAVFLVCELVVGLDTGTSLGWAAVAAIVGAALLQSLRLARTREEPETVNLLGIEVGRRTWPPPLPEPGDGDAPNWFGNLLAAVAIPFIAAYVVVRIALLYFVPTAVVAIAAAAVGSQTPIVNYAAVWGLTVAAAVANEFAVIRPIAKRLSVPLD